MFSWIRLEYLCFPTGYTKIIIFLINYQDGVIFKKGYFLYQLQFFSIVTTMLKIAGTGSKSNVNLSAICFSTLILQIFIMAFFFIKFLFLFTYVHVHIM